jgi:hypothetical protein
MALYLVSYDGMPEQQLKSAQGLEQIQDTVKEAALADAMHARGITALTALTSKGVLVSGSQMEARMVGNVVAEGLFGANVNPAPSLRKDFGAAVVPFTRPISRGPALMLAA